MKGAYGIKKTNEGLKGAYGIKKTNEGLKGAYGIKKTNEGLKILTDWIAAHPAWRAVGDA
ncbi:MAG: hypothetical protein O3B75_10775 [Planctomycetota bacterium]|nr:hypothetical protein [Planctomycetota bacterium]